MYLPPFKGFVRLFVIACVSVFVLEQFARFGPFGNQDIFNLFIRFFGLAPELFLQGMIYQSLTWVFIHGSLSHLLFNMFAFYMFGSMLQEFYGNKTFIKFNIITAVFTALVVVVFSFFDPPTYAATTIGASGLVFGVLMAVAQLFPNQVVLFAFIFPIKMRYFAYILIAIEFYFLYSSNSHGISNIAHLGGALSGYLFVKWSNRSGGGNLHTSDFLQNLKDKFGRKKKRHLRIVYPEDRTRYQ